MNGHTSGALVGVIPFVEAEPKIVHLNSEAQRVADGAANDDDLGIWDAGDDDYQIPPRAWLLGNVFCRKFLSSLVADGGVGKTATRIAQLLSLATGRSLTGEHVFCRCRVMMACLEDDKDELRRRVYAAMCHHGISRAEVKGWLFLWAPKGIRLAEMRDQAIVEGPLKGMLESAVTKRKLDLVCLDPFVKTHSLGENDNGAMDIVCTMLAKLGIEHDIAVDAPHHTNKGLMVAGDANKGRGASSIKDAGRLVYTETPMTAAEAEQFGLSETESRSLIRMDSGKVNIAPPSRDAIWFRLVGVPLENGTELYPKGDNVQTVERWRPPETWSGTNAINLNAILDDIEAGLENGRRYSAGNRATDRAAWEIVQRHLPDKSKAQCQEMIRAWLKSGTLYEADYHDETIRKSAKGLSVAVAKRPT